jgi:chromosome segregation ATPase
VQFNCGKCFQCPGYSIPRKFRCDGVNNCGDNSDEEGCPTSYTDDLEEDETREAELLSQIAQLEQKLSEAELMKQEAQNQLKQVQAQSEESSESALRLGDPLQSTIKDEKLQLENEVSNLKEELDELKNTLK